MINKKLLHFNSNLISQTVYHKIKKQNTSTVKSKNKNPSKKETGN